MNNPPAAASKIVTPTTSPIPKRISGGGRWSPKVAERVRGPYSSKMPTVFGVSLTRPYGGPLHAAPASTTAALGPEAGNSNGPPHPAHASATLTTANAANFCNPHIPQRPSQSLPHYAGNPSPYPEELG